VLGFANAALWPRRKTLRLGKGLTLQQFAKAVGYHAHGYISELEAGKKTPTVEFVLSVSRYYGVSTDQLMRDEIELSVSRIEAGE
jgi:transcriptional regulator with XRE-family HTH domain